MNKALAVAAIISFAMLAVAAPPRPVKHKKNIQDLRRQLSSIRSQSHQVKAELKKTKRAVKDVLHDIHEVDSRLNSLEESLTATESHLEDSRAQAVRDARDLADANVRLEHQRTLIGARIRRIYMQGSPTFLSVLMGARDVGDIAEREALLRFIEKRDRQVFIDYQATRTFIAAKKRDADALVVRIRALIEDQRAQQESLQGNRAQKGHYLRELNSHVGELTELANQFQQDEEEITGQIEAYMREAARPSRPNTKTIHLGKFSGRFMHPIAGAPITSGFGWRYHPILHYSRMHTGVDFGASYGTRIHAAADGIVIGAQRMGGYGNVVILDHGGGFATVYAHCSAILVSRGEKVARGQVIARVGATGLATGPHLHFEVRINGHPVNPIRYL
jgi:murein DD-endopeptidase MepM/ murein hydrolase activator NlpD